MKTELNEQDRERIEQKADELLYQWQKDETSIRSKLIDCATYEHNYQREQQAKMPELFQNQVEEWLEKYSFVVPYDGSNTFYDEDKRNHARDGIDWACSKSAKYIRQLEAERSTLLKAVDLLKRTRYPFPDHPTLQEEIESFLNSLKTK